MPSRVNPRAWPLALLAYPTIGALCGCGLLDRAVAAQGLKPGIATFIAINLAMPLGAVIVAACFPRLWTALLGAILMMLGFVLTRLYLGNHNVLTWDFAYLKAMTSPIEVVAIFGYMVIGGFIAAFVGMFRKFRLPDQHLRCEGCEYLLVDTLEGVCPECGRRFDAERLRKSQMTNQQIANQQSSK